MVCEIEEKTLPIEAWVEAHESAIHLIASRLLGTREDAEMVVHHCLSIARHNTPPCKSKGEFGSWILRIAIDEASRIQLLKTHHPCGQQVLRGQSAEANY